MKNFTVRLSSSDHARLERLIMEWRVNKAEGMRRLIRSASSPVTVNEANATFTPIRHNQRGRALALRLARKDVHDDTT